MTLATHTLVTLTLHNNQMGVGKTEWEDILIEKGIINPPLETQIEHHPDIVYDISNREELDEVDLLFEEDDAYVQEYR